MILIVGFMSLFFIKSLQDFAKEVLLDILKFLFQLHQLKLIEL